MAKVYKVRDEEVEAIKEALMKFVIDKKSLNERIRCGPCVD